VIRPIRTLLLATIPCLLAAGLLSTPASAQDSSYKIAVVDLNTVLKDYEKRQSKYKDLQDKVDALQSGIDKMSKEITAAKEDYEAKRASLSDEEAFKLETKIRNDYATYQSKLQNNQREIDGMEELVLKEVLKDIQTAIEKVADGGNYHLVLNNSKGPRGAVLFAAAGIDITSQILAELNK
jgi:Skp family chaperone for outer membrane proteins